MAGGQRSAGTRATVIVERLRRLEHALVARRGRGRTVDELVALVGTSRSTLYRDLGFLARSGVAIVEQRLDGKTLRRIDATDRPRLTSEQVHALRLARAMLAPLEGSALVREVDALLALQPTHARRPLASAQAAPHAVRPDVVARVERACRTRRQLGFTYRGARDRGGAARVVDPIELRLDRAHLYLVAWDPDRADHRVFKLARMTDVRVLDSPSSPPPGYDASRFFAHARGIWSGDVVDVAIRLAPSIARYAAEWPLVSDQHLDPEPSGAVVVRARVAGLWEAMRWTLTWGRGAQVLAPPELRDRVREELEAALAGYAPQWRKARSSANRIASSHDPGTRRV